MPTTLRDGCEKGSKKGGEMRYPGWVKIQDSEPGSGSAMNVPDHISESLETIFGFKNT
jgi:hypothetical protein